MTTTSEITAAEMADLLIARLRARRDMRSEMPGDVNETLTLELAAMVVALRREADEALGLEQPA